MAAAYIIFALDLINLYFFNAIFITEALELKGSFTFIGIAGSCNALLCFLWKPIAGSLSDKKGTSKLLTWCLFSSFITPILSYASQSLVHLFLCKLILAFSSPTQVLLRTIITNTSSEKQSENLAKLGIISAVSIISAALVSGHLLESTSGLHYVYGIMVANAATNLILTRFLPSSEVLQKQTRSSATNEITTALKNLKTLSTSETYWDIFLSKALVALSFANVESNLVLTFKEKGISGKQLGYVVTLIMFSMFMANILQARINEMFYKNDVGYQRTLHASIVITISLLTQGFTTQKWIFMLCISLMSFCRSMTDNSMMEVLLKKVNIEEKATVLSSFDSVQSLTDMIAPLIAGATLEFSGISSVYLVSAILFALQCSVVNKRQHYYKPTSHIQKEN